MKRLSLLISVCLAFSMAAYAQQPSSPEEVEKKLMEYIDSEVERLTSTLNLEYWQEFYADSTLVHDYHAMQDELKALQESKVTNSELYTAVQDKWNEAIYLSFQKFLDKDQWKKYQKSGALREKKARDKRKEKIENIKIKP